ncbi:MAG TPA: hypothetical protein VM661_13250 [Candidatus Sulfotelmatobacter sp.]|nr:hypothetical protein [Candidatus Sulfotelmatobacter sp.]
MSVTAGLGQMPGQISPALLNPATMQGLGSVAAAFEAQAAFKAQQRPAAPVVARSKGPLDRLLGLDIPFDDIRGEIAQGIDSGIHAAIAANAGAQVVEDFKDALDALMQAIDGQGDLQSWLDALCEGGGQADARRLLQSAERLTSGLSDIAGRIDGLRRQTNEQISQSVDDINAVLTRLADTSNRIAVDAACGAEVSYLFEDRDEQLALLFGLLDVVSFIRGDGAAAVYLRSGTPLIEGAFAKRFLFEDGESLVLDGRDVRQDIGSGRLFGLFNLRDHHLQGIALQLDSLALMIREQVNRLFNRAVAQANSAVGTYAGSREFLNPDFERLAVSGGDCVLTLLDEGGVRLAATSVSLLAARQLLSEGLPTGAAWSVGQFIRALDQWLRHSLKSDAVAAFLDPLGRVCIALPRGRLSWRDQRCTALDSQPMADPEKAIGAAGPLSFRDIFGNHYTVQIAVSDSLRDIAAKLESFSGLKAALVGQREGQILRVSNAQGCDLYVEPDPLGRTGPVALLGLLPAPPLPQGDLTVDWDIDRQGGYLESVAVSEHNRSLGLNGALTVTSQDHHRVEVWLDPKQTLSGLVGQFNEAASCSGMSAVMKGAGNRWVIRIIGASGQNVFAEGDPAGLLGLRPPPDASMTGVAAFFGLNDFFAPPGGRDRAESKAMAPTFSTFNPTCLTVTQREGRRQNFAFPSGQGLEDVVKAVCREGSLAHAELHEKDGMLTLSLTSVDGEAMQVTGSLAVLLGLGDGARCLSHELESRPDLLPEMLPPSAAKLMRDALNAGLDIPAGDALPQGKTSLREAARGILSRHRRYVAEGRAMVLYQHTLTQGLRKHRQGLYRLDMSEDAVQLNSYRDAYLENASVMSGLSRLAAQLDAAPAVH